VHELACFAVQYRHTILKHQRTQKYQHHRHASYADAYAGCWAKEQSRWQQNILDRSKSEMDLVLVLCLSADSIIVPLYRQHSRASLQTAFLCLSTDSILVPLYRQHSCASLQTAFLCLSADSVLVPLCRQRSCASLQTAFLCLSADSILVPLCRQHTDAGSQGRAHLWHLGPCFLTLTPTPPRSCRTQVSGSPG